jgi:hypothetical protein
MENRFQQVIAQINEFLAALSVDNDQLRASGATAEVPRIDAIDFDRLTQTLDLARKELDTASGQERDIEYVAGWFSGRIHALRRGHRALLMLPRTDDAHSEIEKLPLPQLLRLYDEEMSRLKSLCHRRTTGTISAAKRDEYQNYHS